MSICRLLLMTMLVMTTCAPRALAEAVRVSPPAPTPTTPPPAPATTQPVPELPTPVAVALGVVLIALASLGGWLAGVFRPGSIRGPHRLGPGSSVVPILLILLIGGACWMGAQIAFFAVRGAQHARQTGGARMSVEDLRADDLALIATVPALAAMFIVLAADVMFALLRPIGLSLSRLPRWVLVGLGGGVLALMLMHGAGYLLAALYELIGYEHPSEHELLGALKDASPLAQIALVFGACIVAPLFEELLFRGHMQTLLTRLFTPRPPRPAPPPLPAWPAFGPPPSFATAEPLAPPPSLPPSLPPSTFALPETPAPPLIQAGEPAEVRRGKPWLAVVITSIVFAVVHPLWMAPLIFLLSLCLGYAYERTGSLWVPITMHALFNTSSTVLFLLFM